MNIFLSTIHMGTLEVSLSQRWLEPRLIFNLLTKEQYIFIDMRSTLSSCGWQISGRQGDGETNGKQGSRIISSGLFLFLIEKGGGGERGSEGGASLQVIFTEYVPLLGK